MLLIQLAGLKRIKRGRYKGALDLGDSRKKWRSSLHYAAGPEKLAVVHEIDGSADARIVFLLGLTLPNLFQYGMVEV
jgi:hypothetical protein